MDPFELGEFVYLINYVLSTISPFLANMRNSIEGMIALQTVNSK